nr:retrotransposon protein, putative, Ty1-copia subclass [Tanacetum cinerariifolium]
MCQKVYQNQSIHRLYLKQQGVNHKTNVSRPQLRSKQMKDNVVPNNSQVKLKRTQVKDHPKITSISNKNKSVTTSNDSLNSRSLNANVVCATCKKCLVDSNRFVCVTKMLNDVNARTKKPNVVPISTRKPKGYANKSVATLHKKKVASKSTTPKPKSYYRMLYEKTTKAWKWWIKQQCPSGYKWVPKTKMQWVPKVRNENVHKRIVYLILFIVDSGCTKHMTGNLKLLCIFVEKFLGFITSKDSITISSQLVNFVMRIWRLSHLNFNYINMLSKKDVVIGLPKLRYVKDQLCSSCEVSKEKRSSFKSKAVPSLKGRLNLLHIDLCSSMRVASINGKKYILSKGYPVYNKRIRLIVESIHIHFDEIKEMSKTSVVNDTSGLVPQRQKASDYDNSDPTPFTPTYVHAEENNNNQAEEEHLQDNKFTNPLCTPIQEVSESSSYNIGNLNVYDFNKPQVSEYRWTKDHLLEQVHGNPSKPVQTRRQLATDPEMYMFVITVSTAEPKNIKEAMADSAWIEAMQEKLHQFDRLQVWELVDKPFGKSVIRLKWLWKNKNDEHQTLHAWKLFGFLSHMLHTSLFIYQMDVKTAFLNGPLKDEALRAWYDELSKFLTSKGFTKGLQIHQSPRGIFINQAKYALEILHKHGMDKGQSIGTSMAMKPKLDVDLSGNLVDQTDYCGSSFGLTAFSDVDHAGCIDTRKSTSGGIQFLGDKLVSWISKNQDCIAMSSAEYVALSASCAQHSRTKHIHTRYNFIKEQVEIGIIELYFVRTEYQLADMFTKALPEDMFKYFVRRIGMRYFTPAELEVLAKESA